MHFATVFHLISSVFIKILKFNCFNRADETIFPVPFSTQEKDEVGGNTKEKKRKMKVRVGDVVTFSYLSFSAKSGVPVEPKLLMTRYDVTWDDVLAGNGRPSEGILSSYLFFFFYSSYFYYVRYFHFVCFLSALCFVLHFILLLVFFFFFRFRGPSCLTI